MNQPSYNPDEEVSPEEAERRFWEAVKVKQLAMDKTVSLGKEYPQSWDLFGDHRGAAVMLRWCSTYEPRIKR